MVGSRVMSRSLALPVPLPRASPIRSRPGPAHRLSTWSLAHLKPMPAETAHATLETASCQPTQPTTRMTRTPAARSQGLQSTVDGGPDKSGHQPKLPLDFGKSLRESEFLFDSDYRQ